MKIKVGLSLLLLSLVLVACGNRTQEKEQLTKEQQEAAVRKLVDEGYVPYVDGRYELRLTEAEASEKGINRETYGKISQMVEDMNTMLRKQIDEYKNDSVTEMMVVNGDTIRFDKKTK